MTPQSLRDALHHTATPPLPVADDLWARGRRRRRRDRVATAVIVAAVLATIGSLLLDIGGLPRSEVATTDGRPALPRLMAMPSNEDAVPKAPSLAVGPQAAVMTVDPAIDESTVRLVGLDAATGAYRSLPLPHLGTAATAGTGFHGNRPFALSPDGRRLAYPWATGVGYALPPTRTAIGVVDLVTGRVERLPLRDAGLPILLDSLSWSPNGRRLVWFGQRASGGSFADRLTIGTIVPGAPGSARTLALRLGSVQASIADDGTVAIASYARPTGLRTVTPDDAVTVLSRRSTISPYSTCVTDDAVRVDGRRGMRDTGAVRQFVGGDERPVALGDALVGRTWEVLGCRDDGSAVALVGPRDDEPGDGYRLGLITISDGVADVGSASSAVRLSDGLTSGRLSVATDLVGAPTADRPLPPWAQDAPWWRTGRAWAIALLGGIGVIALLPRRRRIR
ncbi:hypothetical protein GCM10022215_27670 [Nocardioides fonticola]|uniref:WD40 repeat domain-containing protein n=1 Tax=Nocardioides fonticola TaxID=450363 RepID=A0ABP7XMD3_9ACTN